MRLFGMWFGLVVSLAVGWQATPAHAQHFPEAIDPACRGGRAKLYDECGSQFAHLTQGMKAAEASGKVVLIVYGAEWCIWCHVFTEYVAGTTGVFDYDAEGEEYRMREFQTEDQAIAPELAAWFEETFVVVHIEDKYSPDGWDVMIETGGAEPFNMGLPFIYTLKGGAYAAHMGSEVEVPGLEVRRDGLFLFRGFDRQKLWDELRRMEAAARSAG